MEVEDSRLWSRFLKRESKSWFDKELSLLFESSTFFESRGCQTEAGLELAAVEDLSCVL
jgi:hypothetical protein